MQGLYRKIIRGMYPNIPKMYSTDLTNVIRAMLQINPSLRPSCDRLLEIPSIRRLINEKTKRADPTVGVLLSTIAFNQKNFKLNLPKANYDIKERGQSADAPRPIDFNNDVKPRILVSARKLDRPKLSREMVIEPLNLKNILPPINDKDAPLSSRRNLPPKPSPKHAIMPTHELLDQKHKNAIVPTHELLEQVSKNVILPVYELIEQKNLAMIRIMSRPEIARERHNSDDPKCERLVPIDTAEVPSPPKLAVASPAHHHRNMNRVASLILGSPKENYIKPEAPPQPNPIEKPYNGQNPIFIPHPVIHHRQNRPGRAVWWN